MRKCRFSVMNAYKQGISRPQKGQPVIINKQTTVKGFTPEEELKYLIERGDWELVLTSSGFKIRTLESQVQLIQEAIDNRIHQLRKSLNYLVNQGVDNNAAATGVIQRLRDLERVRNMILKSLYERYPRALTDKIIR
jgi:hypothetical protein